MSSMESNVVKFPSLADRGGGLQSMLQRQRVKREARAREIGAVELTETAKNSRLRDARKTAWNHACHTTDYWRARMKWHGALSWAQNYGIGDSGSFPPADDGGRYSFVDEWRAALVKQLLTPAPDVSAVIWKRTQLAGEQYAYVGVKRERIERAIADDVAFLEAHPTRRSIAGSRQSSKPEPA